MKNCITYLLNGGWSMSMLCESLCMCSIYNIHSMKCKVYNYIIIIVYWCRCCEERDKIAIHASRILLLILCIVRAVIVKYYYFFYFFYEYAEKDNLYQIFLSFCFPFFLSLQIDVKPHPRVTHCAGRV